MTPPIDAAERLNNKTTSQISTTNKGPCEACGTSNSASFYTITIKRLFVILCPFCFGILSNEMRWKDEESTSF